MNEYPQDFGRGVNMGANAFHGSTNMMSFIAGAAIGAGLALLLAPASGAETRRRLGETASRLGTSVRDGVDHARQRMGTLKDDVRTAVAQGREAYQREREARTGDMTAGRQPPL